MDEQVGHKTNTRPLETRKQLGGLLDINHKIKGLINEMTLLKSISKLFSRSFHWSIDGRWVYFDVEKYYDNSICVYLGIAHYCLIVYLDRHFNLGVSGSTRFFRTNLGLISLVFWW